MTIEIPAIPTQTTTESADLFLMHNVASNRTKGITYNNLKAELTTDIDHVTSAQLASAIAGVTADYVEADTHSLDVSFYTMPTVTTIPSNNVLPIFDSLVGSRKITYANLKAQLAAEIKAATQAQINDIYTQMNLQYHYTRRAILNDVFPVGCKISGIGPDHNVNPSSLLDFGHTTTWVKEEGYFYVGNKSGDIDFQTTGATGGVKAHDHGAVTGSTTLNSSQIPSHTHPYRDRYYAEAGLGGLPYSEYLPSGHNSGYGSNGSDWDNTQVLYLDSTTTATGGGGSHSHSISSTSNLPPYKVEYVWRRTA